MDQALTDLATRAFLKQARQHLEEASGLAKAAEACVDAKQTKRAVEIANGMDEPIDEADRLLGLVAAVARLAKS